MKKCHGCKKNLSTQLFDTSARSRDGFASKCQYCAEKARQNYHKNANPNTVKRDHCVKCAENGIFKKASFGLKDDGVRKACTEHKTDEMINLHMRKMGCTSCEKDGIFKIATFGLQSDGIMKTCVKHKTKDMVDLSSKNARCKDCESNGIIKKAIFGYVDDGIKQACAKHKTSEMVDLAHKRDLCLSCKEMGIFKRATFGFPGDGKLQACAKHKTNEMIDVANRRKGCVSCLEEGVFKIAMYGLKDSVATACVKHKTGEMIDLADKNRGCLLCKENGKFRRASFGFENDGIRQSCKEHKIAGMVDLANEKLRCLLCKENGVYKRASFGFVSDGKVQACVIHKTRGMESLDKNCCVLCAEEGIRKIASYGKLFERKIHCKIHALKNEYNNNNPKCENCFEKPFYGDEKLDELPVRCEEHKKTTDVNMVERKCKNCGDMYFIPSTQVMCHGCLGWIKKKTVNRGVKENKVAFCLEKLSKITGIPKPVRDRKVKDGCSKRRPDFYYTEFTDMFSLIVEVDENQHSRYSCGILGEMQRMIILYEEDSGGFPLLFIRFNPDPYYYKEKVIKAYRGREEKLVEVIKGLKNRDEINFNIGVIYLYYDGFDKVEITPLEYETVDGVLKISHKHPHSLRTEHEIIL